MRSSVSVKQRYSMGKDALGNPRRSSGKLQEGLLVGLWGSEGVSGPSVSQPTVFCVYLFRRGDAVT